MKRIRRRLRRRPWTLAVIAALLITAAVFYVTRPREDLRAGSVEVSSGRVDITSRTPRSYRIVYRSESRAGEEVVASTQELIVKRPFEAVSRTIPEGGEDEAATVNAFARLSTGSTVLAVGPGPAQLDMRPDAFLPEAVDAGYAEQRELRRVAGRLCRIFRLAGSTATPSLRKVARAGEDHSEVCVDEAGLILEEVGFSEGKLLTRKVAVSVDEDPKVDDDMFDVPDPTLEVQQGGGSVRQMAVGSRPPEATFWEPDDDPEGFRHEGRYAVVPPQTGFDDPTQRSGLIAFTADVWVDGSEVIVVEQGATLGGSDPFAEDLGAEFVDVGELGEGELIYGYLDSEVRTLLGSGRFVRVVGTVDPSRLLAVARSLEAREGGELVFTDDDAS